MGGAGDELRPSGRESRRILAALGLTPTRRHEHRGPALHLDASSGCDRCGSASGASVGQAHHGLERLLGPGPVLAQQLRTSGAKRVAQGQRGDEDVIELANHRNEVRYEVDRGRQIGDQREQNELAPPRHMWIANQAAQQHEAIGDEAGERAGRRLPTRD
jgi:hypothetical protein